jgi:hypothetical protein
MGKFISGLPTDNNLDKWADYTKRNSYGDNKAQCRDQLAPVGRGERENDWSDDWKQPATAPNTYTGKGGSKRTP